MHGFGLAHAQPAGWTSIGSSANENLTLEAREGSFELRFNGTKEEIAVITGKAVRGGPTGSVELEKWYVRTKDCKNKQGKAVTLTMDGEFKFDNDFIFGAGNMKSEKAEFICAMYDYLSAEKRGKSL